MIPILTTRIQLKLKPFFCSSVIVPNCAPLIQMSAGEECLTLCSLLFHPNPTTIVIRFSVNPSTANSSGFQCHPGQNMSISFPRKTPVTIQLSMMLGNMCVLLGSLTVRPWKEAILQGPTIIFQEGTVGVSYKFTKFTSPRPRRPNLKPSPQRNLWRFSKFQKLCPRDFW